VAEVSAPTVTIDGPSGVGKTAVARALAGVLGWRWLSAGLLYRALAAEDQPEADLRVEFVEAVDGISDPVVAVGTRRHREPELQRPDIAAHASQLAQDPAVRTRARMALRRIADGGLVLEGRSMARTMPDAALHVYLWADRRARQARAAAIGQRLDDRRDATDQGRAHEPLRVQAGMTLWNSTRYTISETVAALARRTRLALGAQPVVVAFTESLDGRAAAALASRNVEVVDLHDNDWVATAMRTADYAVAVPAGARPTERWLDAHLRVLCAGNDLVTVGPPVGAPQQLPVNRNLTGAEHRLALAAAGNVGMTGDLLAWVDWPALAAGPLPTRLPPDARYVYVADACLVEGHDTAQIHVRCDADRDELLTRLQQPQRRDQPALTVIDHIPDPLLPLLVEAASPGRRVRVVTAVEVDELP
jgi:CMP/dCMP kinase